VFSGEENELSHDKQKKAKDERQKVRDYLGSWMRDGEEDRPRKCGAIFQRGKDGGFHRSLKHKIKSPVGDAKEWFIGGWEQAQREKMRRKTSETTGGGGQKVSVMEKKERLKQLFTKRGVILLKKLGDSWGEFHLKN